MNSSKITDPGGLHPEHWTLRDTAVKRFRRSAADFKLDIPELVRPPEVLERVCGYLEEWVMVCSSFFDISLLPPCNTDVFKPSFLCDFYRIALGAR